MSPWQARTLCQQINTNGNSNITVGEPPPRDPCSAINPANRNFTHPKSDSDSEPWSVQQTASDPPMSSPTFTWGNCSGSEFTTLVDTTYAEVVHWRRNCFSVPFGKAGRDFVSELSRLYLAYGSASMLETVALKAATVLPILLLQKPSKRSKTKITSSALKGD